MTSKAKIGSSFDDFLSEQGVLEDVDAAVQKRIIAAELEAVRKRKRITKQVLARRMKTSRSQLDRLLDPENPKQSFADLARLAHHLGKRLEVSVIDAA